MIAAAPAAGYPIRRIRTHTSLSRTTAVTALTISLDRARRIHVAIETATLINAQGVVS
jgi:hypothetical protein